MSSTTPSQSPPVPPAVLAGAFFVQAGVGFWLAGADGRYLFANAAHARLLGHDSPESLARDVVSISAQVYADEDAWKACQGILAGGPPLTREVQAYGRDGQMVWMRENLFGVDPGGGAARLVGGVARDISRDTLEQGDREAMIKMLRQVMDTITDAMVLADLEGRAVFCNRVFAARFQMEADEVGGRNLGEWLAPLAEEDAAHLRRLEERPVPYNIVLCERGSGALRLTTVSPFPDPAGGLLGAILMLRDDRLLASDGEE